MVKTLSEPLSNHTFADKGIDKGSDKGDDKDSTQRFLGRALASRALLPGAAYNCHAGETPALSVKLSSGLLGGNPIVTPLFQFQRQLLATRAHNPAVDQDMDEVRNNVIEESLVMSDD